MATTIESIDKKKFPDFSGEPKEYDSYIIEQTLLRDDVSNLDKREQGIYRRFGDKGPKIGIEGEDYDVILGDIEAERNRVKDKIMSNIRSKRLHLLPLSETSEDSEQQ